VTTHEPRARTFGYGAVRLECVCGWHEDDGGTFMEHLAASNVRPGWTVDLDGVGDLTLWDTATGNPFGPDPIIRKCDLPFRYREELWDRLIASCQPDTSTPTAEDWSEGARYYEDDPSLLDTSTRDTLAREPGDYAEAWFRLSLPSPDTKAAAFVALHVSRLTQERDELKRALDTSTRDDEPCAYCANRAGADR
jgi:hypothetical protein